MRRPGLRVPAWFFDARVGAAVTLAILAVTTAILGPLLSSAAILDAALVYLLITLLAAATWGYAVGLATAVLADLLVNFFFAEPLYRLTVQQPRNVVALALFLAVAAVGASMLSLLRRQLRLAAARATETSAVLELSTAMAHAISAREALHTLCVGLTRAFGLKACAVLACADGQWRVADSAGPPPALTRDEEAAAAAAFASGEAVRLRPTAPRATQLTFVPFGRATPEQGCLRLAGAPHAPPGVTVDRLLATFADEASLALHRMRLTEEAAGAEMLRRADEFKSVILSSVSHDLRSPLTAIKAAVSSLRDPALRFDRADRAALLETIESQTDRLTGTVSDLLEISRLEGGAARAHQEPVEVSALLGEAAASFRRLHPGRMLEVQAEEGLSLRSDYVLLLQALGNLLENAARYSRPDGAIVLGAEQERRRLRLFVRDAGPPIAAADVPHLFEKFYRGGTAAGTRGSGLGLAIVKAMAELCGGFAGVEAGGTGNEFFIELAAAPVAVS